LTVSPRGFEREVAGLLGSEVLRPAQQFLVAGRGVGEGLVLGLSDWPEQTSVECVFADVQADPDSRGWFGSLFLLHECSSRSDLPMRDVEAGPGSDSRRLVPPRIVFEVKNTGGLSAIWFTRSGLAHCTTVAQATRRLGCYPKVVTSLTRLTYKVLH
jgi:hypothetical protein